MASPKHKTVKTDVIQLNRPPSKEWTRHDLNLKELACAGSERVAAKTLSGVHLLGQLASSVGRGRSVAELAMRALRSRDISSRLPWACACSLLIASRSRSTSLRSAVFVSPCSLPSSPYLRCSMASVD